MESNNIGCQNITLKLINIQGLTKTKSMEVEKLINDHTIWISSYQKYINMRDKQSKKGGGLMIIHKNKQVPTELEQIYTKQEDILILRGTLKT